MNPWRGVLGLPRRVWLLCGCTLVNRIGTMAFPFLTLFLIQGRHWSADRAGAALFGYGAGGLLAALFVGGLADRVGHNRMMALSLWGSGLMLLALPLVSSATLMFPAIFLWAVFNQAFTPSAMAVLTGLAAPEQRRAVFALHRVVTNLGMAVGPALGGIIAMFSFRWVFWTDGLSTLVSAYLLLRLFRPAPALLRPAPAAEPARGRSAWTNRKLTLLLVSFLPVALVFFQTLGIYPLWVMRDLHFSSRFFGLLFTMNTLLIVTLEVALNLAMAHWPHRYQLTLGALLFTLGFGLTGLAHSRLALLLTVVLWTFGEMILLPAVSDAVATLAPERRRGEYLGLYSLAFAVAMTFGPWLGLLTYTHAGPAAAWAGCALLGCASAAGLLRFRLGSPAA